MARQVNTRGHLSTARVETISKNRNGTIEIRVDDPDVIVPDDVTRYLPDPFCKGCLLYGMADQSQVLVHFPADERYREAGLCIFKILDRIVKEAFEPTENQSVFTLQVTGDWHRLRMIGSKELLFSIHTVEMERCLGAAQAATFG